MKKPLLLLLLLSLLASLCGCSGGQEIESCLFVLAMAIDPAENGGLTVTVKALSGTQEAAQAQSGKQTEQTEAQEPGYIVLSATAPSCLRALNLLSSTTPRTVNLSQLREIVLSRTLAESGAALSMLREIHAMYRANGEAIVVVTPDNAGDFIRRQRAILGVRLSKYLEVLFDHFSSLDTIPPFSQLTAVIAAMESGTHDAAVVYAAANRFDSTLMLPGSPETDRLPGHLPRTSPAENEYLGCALFSGARMTGTLTGEETGLLCLMMGKARRRLAQIGGAQYKTNLATRVRRSVDAADGALRVHISMNLTRIAGEDGTLAADIARQIETDCTAVLRKLQAASCDAAGFGRLAIRRCADVAAWEKNNWRQAYENAPVCVSAQVRMP